MAAMRYACHGLGSQGVYVCLRARILVHVYVRVGWVGAWVCMCTCVGRAFFSYLDLFTVLNAGHG